MQKGCHPCSLIRSLPFAYTTSNTFICGIKILRFNENDILVQINFGVQDILWLSLHSEEKLMLIRQFCSIFYQMHIVASHNGILIFTQF